MVQNEIPLFKQVPTNLRLKIKSGETPTDSKWEYGSIFVRADAPFKAVEQVKAMLNIFTQIGGQASGNGHSGNPSDHIYGSEVEITASPDSHYEWTRRRWSRRSKFSIY